MSETELSLQDAQGLIDSGGVDQRIGSEDGSVFSEPVPRRDDAGRYTGSEQKFGVEGLEADAGYVPLSDLRKAEGKTYHGDGAAEKAFGDLEASGFVEPEDPIVPVEWYKTDGSGDLLEPNVTTTLDQAAEAHSTYHEDIARYVDGMEIDAVRDTIDQARAELLKSDPKNAELYGLDAKAVEANARTETADVPAQQAQQSTEIEGTDEELTRALKHPRIADAVASEWTKAEAVGQQYQQAIAYAHQVAQASLLEALPGLANIPVSEWESAIVAEAQRNPQAVQRALAPLQRATELQAAQSQLEQHRSAQQQQRAMQQFESLAETEDARLVQMVGKEAADQATAATMNYLSKNGVAPNQRVSVFRQNPVLATAEARQVIWKAEQYDRLLAAPKAVASKGVAPVQKPGNGSGKSRAEISLAALENRFNKTGSIDDAFNLYQARSNR